MTAAGGRVEFLNLGEDNLLAILSFCGISGVISTSQVRCIDFIVILNLEY